MTNSRRRSMFISNLSTWFQQLTSWGANKCALLNSERSSVRAQISAIQSIPYFGRGHSRRRRAGLGFPQHRRNGETDAPHDSSLACNGAGITWVRSWGLARSRRWNLRSELHLQFLFGLELLGFTFWDTWWRCEHLLHMDRLNRCCRGFLDKNEASGHRS